MAGELIMWDRPKLERLKRALAKAVATAPTDEFEFEGHTFVIGYAVYLIEYLEVMLKP